MYVTTIQGNGKIGFLECFEIKDKLKKIGAQWHSSVKMWVLTTQDDISTTMNNLGVDIEDYRIGDSIELYGGMDEILFSKFN